MLLINLMLAVQQHCVFAPGYTMAHCDQTLVVTAWVPLVDATIENGCMYVLPWRFDQGILPHKTGEIGNVAELKHEKKMSRVMKSSCL